MGQKLVSFSLYGTDKRYHDGAIANAGLMKTIYPGWNMRVYCADDVDANKLERMGVQIERMGVSHEHSGMLWRFLPAWDPDIDRVIFRDLDSRINPKEAAAVAAWMVSGKMAHSMHDHPHHGCLPVMGGMWGIIGNSLPNLMSAWTRFMSGNKRRVMDMQILRTYVWPHIKDSVLTHSSVKLEWPYEPFPPHAQWNGFIGQQIDDNGNQVWP